MSSRAQRAFLLCCLCALAACGDDGSPRNTTATPDPQRPTPQAPAPECLRFCQHANGCAVRAGRRVPPAAADCARACAPGGPHAAAPPEVWACADQSCGEPFESCSLGAMMAHMRGQAVGVFPPICVGLCNKAAFCAERQGRPLGPAEQDCETACRPGGVYAAVAERELLCVHEPCGPPFARCREAGGPAEDAPAPP